MFLLTIAAALAQVPAVISASPRLLTAEEARAKSMPRTEPMPGDPATVAAIRALEHEWGQAFPRRDFAFLERTIAPEFRLASAGPDGVLTVTSRADWMRNTRAFHTLAFTDRVIDVMTAGDTAVAMVDTLWTVQQLADRPAKARRGLCADTWVRRSGKWQVVYRHCHREPGAAPPIAGAPR